MGHIEREGKPSLPNESLHHKHQILRRAESSESDVEEKDLLTPRQVEILKLTARGYRNKEIAQELEIKLQTVKNHFSARIEHGGGNSGIFERLGVQSRTEAVTETIRRGFLKLEEI